VNQQSQFWRALAMGGAIAALCLFPLLNGLSSAPVWLHWTIADSLETLVAWAVASCAVAATLANGPIRSRPILRDLVLAAWLMTAAVFVCGAVVKFEFLNEFLSRHRHEGSWAIAMAGALLTTGATYLTFRPGPHELSRLQRIASAMWPAVLLLLFNLVRAPGLASAQLASHASTRQSQQAAPSPAATSGPNPGARTVVLLFDELSPDYLYGSRAVDMAAYPALAQVLAHGQIRAGTQLQGGRTELAIPALFASTPSSPRGLVPALRAQGLSVRVWGWYHDYCADMARDADACKALSIYNTRTLHSGFSIVDPWWTDLNLLPAVFPFSLLKNPPAIAMHRRTLEVARQWLQMQLADASADVIYVHVNVPHLPLLHARPNDDPFQMNEAAYLAQFADVDGVVAQVLHSNQRPTQLIVLSDHNARPLFPKAAHSHVVFMRWRSWRSDRQDIAAQADVPQLLAHTIMSPADDQ